MNTDKMTTDTPSETYLQVDPSLKPIIETLEKLFQQLNDRFFESALSKPVITVAPDPLRKDKLGWCTCKRVWQDDQSEGYFEINICAEHLDCSYDLLCGVLLHEMCHLLNIQNGVKDTSRGGSYHNEKFKETAEAHGLLVAWAKNYGYTDTTISPEVDEFINSLEHTKFNLYRSEIVALRKSGIPIQAKSSSTRKYKCPTCNTTIRSTKDVSVRCETCDARFEKL